MNDSTIKKRFLEVFLKEWEQRSDPGTSTVKTANERGVGGFDSPLNAGELRLFAQGDNGLVGLLYKKLDDGWILMPTSEFTVPATEQEILIGKRVYQLWNTFTVPDEFAERSWLIGTVAESDMKDLCAALLHVMVGDALRADLLTCVGLPITSINDPRLEYERTFAMGRFALAADANADNAHMLTGNGIFDLPSDFWRRTMDEVIPSRLAAASDGDTSFMLLLGRTPDEDAIRKSYVECELMNDFRSINPGDDPYKLLFRPKQLPSDWARKGNAQVQMRNRNTLEVVGDGHYDAQNGEIVITTRSAVESSVDRLEQLVLAMAHDEV